MNIPDFTITRHGGVDILYVDNPRLRTDLDELLPPDAKWNGPDTILVEPACTHLLNTELSQLGFSGLVLPNRYAGPDDEDEDEDENVCA